MCDARAALEWPRLYDANALQLALAKRLGVHAYSCRICGCLGVPDGPLADMEASLSECRSCRRWARGILEKGPSFSHPRELRC